MGLLGGMHNKHKLCRIFLVLEVDNGLGRTINVSKVLVLNCKVLHSSVCTGAKWNYSIWYRIVGY